MDENSNDITSRSYMALRIDKNLGKQLEAERNKNKRKEKLLFHAKDYSRTCIRETVVSKKPRAEVPGAKFICIDIAERRNSV